MKHKKFSGSNGLYLVIDPSMPLKVLLPKLTAAIKGGIDIVQVWDNWQNDTNKVAVLEQIATIAHTANIPVLVNEQAELLEYDFIDGVHFDTIPVDFEAIVASLNRPVLMGITAGNDFETIEWAATNNLDYISFCSVFPSESVNTCNLVTREIILKARGYTSIPIFLAGGINLNNIHDLKDTGMNGVALISGIMGAENVEGGSASVQTIFTQLKQSIMTKTFAQKLVCPQDKSELNLQVFTTDTEHNIIEGVFTCNTCKRYYPVIYGLPIMTPDEYRQPELEMPVMMRWEKQLNGKVADGFLLLNEEKS